jgi:hypothetical protein
MIQNPNTKVEAHPKHHAPPSFAANYIAASAEMTDAGDDSAFIEVYETPDYAHCVETPKLKTMPAYWRPVGHSILHPSDRDTDGGARHVGNL